MMKSTHIKAVFFSMAFLVVLNSYSQEKIFKGNPDTAFETARQMAFNNQRKQAQDTLLLILTKYPDYLDIRSFLGSTYSWDGNYKLARKAFEYVLNKDPKRKTDWIAAINNELYAELPYNAFDLVKKALVHFPEDVDILFYKAKTEYNLEHPEKALRTLDDIIAKDNTNEKVNSYRNSLVNSLRFNSIGLSSSVVTYDKNERAASQYGTLSYSRQTKYGSIIGKVNYSRRFETNNIQYEVDLYPRISNGLYAYVSAGFSTDDFFPSVRYGAELYKSLPNSFEASLGFRGLKFSTTTIIYTGSVGWYKGSSYWSFRTYITPGDNGSSKSGTLQYRKYYSDADNYFSLAIGFGFSPEVERFPVNENEIVVFDLQSQKISGGYSFTSSNKKHVWNTSLNISREEKSFSKGDYYLIYTLGISYNLRFK